MFFRGFVVAMSFLFLFGDGNISCLKQDFLLFICGCDGDHDCFSLHSF